ncbi:MAG: hypothetical protein JRG91_08950 [Deltaproteobacteria bacterium]|nr:hypothetical protein [Deltaproteobacteria bacterium]
MQIPEQYARFERDIRARERHVDVMVVSWVVMGVFNVLYGLGLSAIIVMGAGSISGNDPTLRIVMPVFAVLVLLACIGLSVWYLLTAWGLHRRKRSARISSYVLAGLLACTVFLLPLSLYAYWVLVGSIADMAFGRFSPAPGNGGNGVRPRLPRTRKPRGPRDVEVVPPENRTYRPNAGTYPKPHVAVRTPPAGVPRYVPTARQEPAARTSISSMETINDMPAPRTGGKNKSS